MRFRRIFLTGAAGYVGSRLAPRLLELGHEVVAYDAFYFGDRLRDHERLTKVRADVRDESCIIHNLAGCDAVIHLACISNDPSFELDESLSRTINYEAFEPLVEAAKAAGVRRFVYASSSSVYGVSDSPDVREDHPLVPITLYNTYKAKCEPVLLRHSNDDFVGIVVRPSTVCGYSPRLRLDLAVNILTHLAIARRKISVFGGKQMRPNLHIEDMVDCYVRLLEAPDGAVAGETFNVGSENRSIADLARLVRGVVEDELPHLAPIEIEETASVDPRSYQVNSDKIASRLGFVPKRGVEDAVMDLVRAFVWGLVPGSLTDDRYYNVKRMRAVYASLYGEAPPSEFKPERGVLSEIDMLRARGRW